MTDEDFEESELNEPTRLPVHFKSLAEAESVYRSDISRGGIFVSMIDPLPLRDLVEVEFSLDQHAETLCFKGEVVRRETGQDAPASGVAVAFTQPMAELRMAFQGLLGPESGAGRDRVPSEAVFAVEPQAQGASPLQGDALGISVVDLAASGFSLGQMLDVIPETEMAVRQRVDALLEAGVLLRR